MLEGRDESGNSVLLLLSGCTNIYISHNRRLQIEVVAKVVLKINSSSFM